MKFCQCGKVGTVMNIKGTRATFKCASYENAI